MNKYKKLSINIGLLSISNFASKILVFLLVPLYTSVLSTAEYGKYDLIVTIVQLVIPIVTFNIVDAVMRFSMDSTKSIEDIVSIGLKYIVMSFFIIAIILEILYWLNCFQSIKKYLVFIFLYYAFNALNQFFTQLAKGLEQVRDMAIAGILGTVAMITLNIFCLLVFEWGLLGFFLANIISQAIPCLYLIVRTKVWKYFKLNNIDMALKKEMISYSVPLIFATVGWWVNSASDRLIVSIICGVGANGILSVAYKIPSIINTFQGIFMQAWQISAISEYGKDETEKFYQSTYLYLNMMMCISCTGLIILSKPIAHILYSKDFYQAWAYVPFLLISSVLNAASGFVGPILSARKDSLTMARAAVWGAGTNLFLNIALVYLIGIQGATVATAISSYIIFAIRNRAVGDTLKGKNYRMIMISWGLLCVQAGVMVMGGVYIIQCVIIVGIVLIYKNPICELFNKSRVFLLKQRLKSF